MLLQLQCMEPGALVTKAFGLFTGGTRGLLRDHSP
jgi:hypothetical protein